MPNNKKYILIFVAIISIAIFLYIISTCGNSNKSREGLQTSCTWYIKSATDMGDVASGSTTSGSITSLPTCSLGDVDCKSVDIIEKARQTYNSSFVGITPAFKMGTILASNKVPNANQCDFAFEKLTSTDVKTNTSDSRRFTFSKPLKIYPTDLCSVASVNTAPTIAEKCTNWCDGCGAIPYSTIGELTDTARAEYTNNNCIYLINRDCTINPNPAI